MSTKTLRQIAELETLQVPELKARWRKLFGAEPPTHQRRFLIKRLAYRLQELTHGGLSDDTRRRAAEVVREAGLDEEARDPQDVRASSTTHASQDATRASVVYPHPPPMKPGIQSPAAPSESVRRTRSGAAR
jgi:hypothetical protein